MKCTRVTSLLLFMADFVTLLVLFEV